MISSSAASSNVTPMADAVAHSSHRAPRQRGTNSDGAAEANSIAPAIAATAAAASTAAAPATSRPSSRPSSVATAAAAHGPVNGLSWKEYLVRSLARESKYARLFEVQSLSEEKFMASKYATLGTASTPSSNNSTNNSTGAAKSSNSSVSSDSKGTHTSDTSDSGWKVWMWPAPGCARATPQCEAALRIMDELCRNGRVDGGVRPAAAACSPAIEAVIKRAVDSSNGPPSSTPSSTQGLLEPPQNIAWMASALHLFLPECLADIALASRREYDAEADPQRFKIDLKVARQALKCLGTFLHNPDLVKCFPQPRAQAWIRARRREAEAAALMHEERKGGDGDSDMHDASSAASSTTSADSQESYFAAHDGFDQLLNVAVSTSDRTVATWVCWLLAEQALDKQAMAAYVSPLLDSLERMMAQFHAREKVQQAQIAASAAAVSPTKTVAKAVGSSNSAATAAASLQSLNSLHSEALRAIAKIASNCQATLRARSIRPAQGNDDHPMRWMHTLVIEPFLSPSAFFACSEFPPVPTKGNSQSPALSTHASSLELRVKLRGFALDLIRWMLADDLLARHIVFDKFAPTNALPSIAPGCTRFALSMHSCIVKQEWVKAVAAELTSRATQLENVRLEARKAELADARGKQVKIEGQSKAASAPISSRQASYALSDASCKSREVYESSLLALYSEAFQLLEVYLATMGPLCSFAMPPLAPASASASGAVTVAAAAAPTDKSSSSGVAINEFFTLATLLFRVDSTPCAALRALAFESLWLPICRQLNVGFRMAQVDATAAFLAQLASGARIDEPRFPAALHKLQSKPLPVTLKPFLHHLPKEPDASAVAAILRTALVILGEHFVSLAPMPASHEEMAPSSTPASSAHGAASAAAAAAAQSAVFVLPNLHPCAPHRIWDPIIYSACLAPLLALLCPFPAGAPLAPASAASSSAAASSSGAVSLPLLKFEASEKWDSHARARMLDRLIDLFKQADAAAKAAAAVESAHHGGQQPSTAASSCLSYVSLSSNSSALPHAPTADPLSFLPALFNALLSAPASNLPRASFLSWIGAAVHHRMLAKIAGNTERKAAISEAYAYLLEKAVHLSLSAARSKLSSSSSKAALAAAVSPIANAPPSLLHALFHSWSGFALSLASRAVLVRPAGAVTSPTASALSVERHANRVLFMAQMQTEILNLWMSHRSRLEMLPNLVLEGEQPAAPATTAISPRSPSDAGYNATPTPLSAPAGGSTVSQSPPGFSAPLASFFNLWCTTFSPLLSDRLCQQGGDLSAVADRLKDVFLEGVLSMVEAHLHRMARVAETQRAQPAAFHRAAGSGSGGGSTAAKFNSLQCLSSVLESLIRSQIQPDGSRAHLVTLLYTLHLKTHAVLLRELLPAQSGEGGRPRSRAGSEGTLGSVSPSMAAGASLESMGGGGGGAGAGAGAAAGGTLGSEAPSISAKSVSSRESLSRVARSLANAVSQHLSEEADSVQQLWMHDPSAARAAQDASESSRADQAVEASIAAVLLPTRLPSLMSPAECAAILPAFSSVSAQLVRLALSNSDFESPVANMPDVLSSLTSAMLDVLRECGCTTSAQGFGNLLRIAQTLMAALHPASPSAPHKSSSADAAASSSNAANLVSWKQWKTHVDASVQKVINALLEEAVRRGLDQQQQQNLRSQSQSQQQSQRSKTDGDAMEDVPVATPIAAASAAAAASAPQLDFATFLPFVQSLTQLLARLTPTGSTNLDAIAWVLRMMPAFHSLLRALHGSIDPSFSLTSAPLTPVDGILIAVGQLWTTALQAFRSNWGARTYDFNLLQAVVSKTTVAASAVVASSQQIASTPRALAASSSSAGAAPVKDVLFIDMLTLSLLHSLASVRAAAVSFWTHTYAAGAPPSIARKHSSATVLATSLARLHFHAHPEFVAACRARCEAGELKEWQVPLTPVQQAEANAAAAAAAQAALVGSLVAPFSLQMGSQQQQLASPNGASRNPGLAPHSAASTAARSDAAPATAAAAGAVQSSPSWIPVSQSPTLLHFKQNDKRTVVGGGRDADAAVSSSEATGGDGDGEDEVVDLTKDAGAVGAAAAKADGGVSSHSSDDMNLTGMMADGAAVSSAQGSLQPIPPANSPPVSLAALLAPVAPQSAEKAASMESPPPPSTPLPTSSAGLSPSCTAATSSGASHAPASAAAGGVSSTSHSFLPSNAFSKRRTNLLDRMAAVTPRIPSDLVAAPAVIAAAQQPNHEMVRTASDVLAIAQAQAARQREAEAEAAAATSSPEAAARNTLSPFPVTPKAPAAAAVTPDSVVSSAAAAKPSAQPAEADTAAPVRLLSEFERASPSASAPAATSSNAAAPAAPAAAVAGFPPMASSSPQPRSSQPAAAPMRAASTSRASQAAAAGSGHVDDIAQSLSLPMGSSISQPQLPVEEESEEQAEGHEAAVALAQPGATQAAAAPATDAPDADGDAQMGDAAAPVGAQPLSPPKTGRTPSWLQRARSNLQVQSQPVVGATKDIPLPILSAPAHVSVPATSQTAAPVAAVPPASQAARTAVLEASTQSFAGPDVLLVAPAEPAVVASQGAAATTAPVGAAASAVSASQQIGSESAVTGAIDASPAAPIFPSAADVMPAPKPAAPAIVAPLQSSQASPTAAASSIPQVPPADTAAAVDAAATTAEPAAASPAKKKRERDSPTHSSTSSARDTDTRESVIRARRSPSPSGGAAAAASSARRVMFSEAANVAISPSPLFSTLSPSVHASSHGSRDEEHEAAAAVAGEEKQVDEEEESPVEKALRLSLTPLSHSQSELPPKKDDGPVLTRAERVALRASQMASHAEKKAALKALANPPGAATQQAAGGPIPILKRTPTPAHPAAAAAATEAASSSSAAAAASSSASATAPSSLHPSLSSSLSPVSHLVSCFPSSSLGRMLVSSEGSFFSHVMHWVTVGDVAATAVERVKAAVESKGVEWSTLVVNAITAAAAKKGVASQDTAAASSPVDRIVQLIRSALAAYEEKQTASHRKRKTPAPEPESNDALVAVLPEETKQDEPQQPPANPAASLANPAPAAMTDDAPAAAAVTDAPDSSSSSAFKKARITPAGGSDPAAAQIAHQDRTLFLSAPTLGAGTNDATKSRSIPATAFVSMPAPAGLVRQLSASRAASASQSQQLSCNSQRANSSSSPCMPFVAPEFTFRGAAAPSSTTSNPAPAAVTAAAANAVEASKPAAPIKPVASPALPLPSPPAHRQSTSDTSPSAAVAVISSSPAAAFAAPSMPLHAPAPVAAPTMLRPQALPASDSLPHLESATTSAFVPPALSIRPALAAASSAAAALAPDDMADAAADEADADGSVVDLAGSGSEDQDGGPMGAQMDRLRFHMRSSMAMLFAPTHTLPNGAAAAHVPAINAPPPVFGQRLSPPPAVAAASASAFPSVFGSNVVADLSLSQLREIHSYAQSMVLAVQQQMRRRERSETAAAQSRRESIGGGATTPNRTQRRAEGATTPK